MKKQIKKEDKYVTFDDVVSFIHKCEDLEMLKKIDKVLSGSIIYTVNVVPDVFDTL